jgi:hypothetical protein
MLDDTTVATPPAPSAPVTPPVPAAPVETFEVPIPPAVRRAAERADALHAEFLRGVAAGAPAGAPDGTGGEPTPAPAGTPPGPQDHRWSSPDTGVPAAPVEGSPPSELSWEQRCKTIQGKYDAEVPRFAAQLAAAQTEIARLSAQVSRLEIEKLTAPAHPPARADVPPADVETFGEDLVTASRRWARAEVAQEIDALRAEFGQLRNQTTAAAQTTAQSRVEAALAQEISNWAAIDYSQEFHNWLAEPDLFSGQPRKPMLQDAYKTGDAPRVVGIFKQYLREHTVPGQVNGTHLAHTPTAGTPPGVVAGSVPLETFAAPGTARGGTSGAGEPPMITRAYIAAHYGNIVKGRYRSNPAEQARVQRIIDDATAAGRVLPS